MLLEEKSTGGNLDLQINFNYEPGLWTNGLSNLVQPDVTMT